MSKATRNERLRRFKQTEFERLGGRCPFCGKTMTFQPNRPMTVTFDHVVAVSRGGSNGLGNGQIMCAECNNRKGSHSNDKFVADKVWLLPKGPVLTLYKAQRHAAVTGEAACLRAMGAMCIDAGCGRDG